jgi:hypothetical protein
MYPVEQRQGFQKKKGRRLHLGLDSASHRRLLFFLPAKVVGF